ncbi:class F sortase [Bacillus sp. 2205SS5-2]|uniref:class F sortase n=1 Tax=Bacillus sp. 2205SS5-2 TaxID=3109031 RepID=UPI003006CAAD
MGLLGACSASGAVPQVVQEPFPKSLETVSEVNEADLTLLIEEDLSAIIPTKLPIPEFDIEAPIKAFGLDSKGNMELPENGVDVTWFQPGYKPGEKGNAVLAGHVDDEKMSAIFLDFKNERKDEEAVTFIVREKIAYDKDRGPMQRIFGPNQADQLNLISCTGYFGRVINNYVERLVVYTELK